MGGGGAKLMPHSFEPGKYCVISTLYKACSDKKSGTMQFYNKNKLLFNFTASKNVFAEMQN